MTSLELGIGSACLFLLSLVALEKTKSWQGKLIGTLRAALNLCALFAIALMVTAAFGKINDNDCSTDYDSKGAYVDCR